MAEVFQSGRGGENWTVFSWDELGEVHSFSTPRGRVHRTTSAAIKTNQSIKTMRSFGSHQHCVLHQLKVNAIIKMAAISLES